MDGKDAPKPYRHRHDGLTPARRLIFLARLRETGCVADACRAARISATTARRARTRIPDFADGWDIALEAERPLLRQAAFGGPHEVVLRGVPFSARCSAWRGRW